MIYTNLVVPIDCYDRTMQVLYWGTLLNHPHIVIKSTRREEVLAVDNAIEYADKGAIFPFPTIEIDNLESGEYEVYTSDEKHHQRSYGVKFTMTGDSKYQLLERTAGLAGVDVHELFKQDEVDEANKDMISFLFDKYNEVAEENKEKTARLLIEYIALVNRRLQNEFLTPTEMTPDKESGVIPLDDLCSRLLRYDLINGKVEQIPKQIMQTEFKPQESEDSLYLYVQISDRGIPVNFYISFTPSHEILNELRTEKIARDEQYQRALEKTISYPKNYLSFTDTERPLLSVIENIQPSISLLKAPRLYPEYGECHAQFDEDTLKMLSLWPDRFYLAINEPDMALESESRRRIRIPGRDFSFYRDELSLAGEDYLYWVEDEIGIIYSDIKVLQMRQTDNILGVEEDSEKTQELNERLRLLNIYKYAEHLQSFVQAEYPQSSESVKNGISACEVDDEIDTSNMGEKILRYACIPEFRGRFVDLALAVLKDRLIYGRYIVDFFGTSIKVNANSDTVALPPSKLSDVTYKIEKFNINGNHSLEYVKAERMTAIDYRFFNTSFAVVSAIDMGSGRTSGFLLLDFENETPKVIIKKFLMPDIERKD